MKEVQKEITVNGLRYRLVDDEPESSCSSYNEFLDDAIKSMKSTKHVWSRNEKEIVPDKEMIHNTIIELADCVDVDWDSSSTGWFSVSIDVDEFHEQDDPLLLVEYSIWTYIHKSELLKYEI